MAVTDMDRALWGITAIAVFRVVMLSLQGIQSDHIVAITFQSGHIGIIVYMKRPYWAITYSPSSKSAAMEFQLNPAN